MATANRVPRRRERPEQPRSKSVRLTYNDAELAIVREAAGRAGMAVSSWIARTALDAACGVVLPMAAEARVALEELIQARGQLRRVGNNLNQIALVLNSRGNVPAVELDVVLRAVAQAVGQVDVATVRVMRERRPR